MAKKKKRKLKKSVKRGCLTIIALPLLILLVLNGPRVLDYCKGLGDLKILKVFGDAKDRDSSHGQLPTASAETLAEMHDRLDHLFQIPQRLDTATIALEVYDIESRTVVYSRHADRLAPPASCLKLLTAVGAMEYLGVNHHYVTQVSTSGQQQGSTLHGDVIFEFDDDPMLESLQPMVDAVSRQGIRHIDGNIVLQLLREDTLKAHHTAATWDIPYNKLPILLKGRARIAAELRTLLAAKGITLSAQNPPKDLKDPKVLIYHHETPLTDVLAPMLIHSSNIKADGLYGHLHRVADVVPLVSVPADWWVLPLLNKVGGETTGFVVNDGSGLSPENRLTADFLVHLLEYAWEHEDMRRVLLDEALATPAHPTRHGSLLGRMSAPLYRNKIFVKTGTLTTIGLSSLAGYVQGADGRWYIFAIINENSPVAESRIFQDTVCKELVR